SDGRLSVVLPFPFSSCTSWPSTQFTSESGSPVLVTLKGVSKVLDQAPPCASMVSTLRDGLQVGEALVMAGLLPLRITSATPPFSTAGPSGISSQGPRLGVGQVPLAVTASLIEFPIPLAFPL